MIPLADFLKGCLIDDLDESRQQAYFAQFRYQFQSCPQHHANERGEWARGFLEQLAVEDLQAYRRQWISPKVYSYFLFIWKLFDLCTRPEQYDPELIEQLWANPIMAAYSKQEQEAFLAAMKKEIKERAGKQGVAYGEHYVWPTLKELPTFLFTLLIQYEKTQLMKNLISFLYFSYEEKLQRLLETSDSLEKWLWNIAEIMPYLLLKNFVPIHDTLVVKDPRISFDFEALPGSLSHLADPGTVSRVSRFFRDLFTSGEIEEFERRGQRISETFAHLYPVLLGDIEESLQQRKAEVLEVARRNGRLQGQKLAIIQYKQRLRIPKFVFEEIKASL